MRLEGGNKMGSQGLLGNLFKGIGQAGADTFGALAKVHWDKERTEAEALRQQDIARYNRKSVMLGYEKQAELGETAAKRQETRTIAGEDREYTRLKETETRANTHEIERDIVAATVRKEIEASQIKINSAHSRSLLSGQKALAKYEFTLKDEAINNLIADSATSSLIAAGVEVTPENIQKHISNVKSELAIRTLNPGITPEESIAALRAVKGQWNEEEEEVRGEYIKKFGSEAEAARGYEEEKMLSLRKHFEKEILGSKALQKAGLAQLLSKIDETPDADSAIKVLAGLTKPGTKTYQIGIDRIKERFPRAKISKDKEPGLLQRIEGGFDPDKGYNPLIIQEFNNAFTHYIDFTQRHPNFFASGKDLDFTKPKK